MSLKTFITMRRYTHILIIITSLILIGTIINNASAYVIDHDNNSVWVQGNYGKLEATPHTLTQSGWVYFNITPYQNIGNIDMVWGFNTTKVKPKKAEFYKPHWINWTTHHDQFFWNISKIESTFNNCCCGNEYNTYKRKITYQIYGGYNNVTNEIIYKTQTKTVCFDSYTHSGNNYTIYWHTNHSRIDNWIDVSNRLHSVNYNYDNKTKWWYVMNFTVEPYKTYTGRAWINVPITLTGVSGKYDFAVKRSSDSLHDAISNHRFYLLDPWFDSSWSTRRNLYINCNESLNYYPINLNLSYSDIPEAQNDFNDIRFVNITDNATLPYWVEDRINGSWCSVWVNVTSLHAGWNNNTVVLYYGNSEATSASNIDTTTIDGWDFESDTVGNVPLGWTEDSAHGSLRVVDGKTTRMLHNSNESSPSNNYVDITSIIDDNNRMIQFTITPLINNTYDYIIIHDSSEHVTEGIFLAFKSDGYIYYYDGNWALLIAYDTFTDYKIKLYNIDLTNNRYDIDINGVNRGVNLKFCAPQSTLNYFTYEGSGGEITDENIDNVFVNKHTVVSLTYILGNAESYLLTPPTPPSFINIDLIDQGHHEYTHIEPQTMHIPIYNGTNYISIPLYQYNPTLDAVFGDNPITDDTITRYTNNGGTHTAQYWEGYGWYGEVSKVEPIEPCVGYKYERKGDNFILNISGYMKYNITIFNYNNRVGTNIIKPMRSNKDD